MKTTNAVKFPKHILLGFERGWGAINGVMAQPINSWKDAIDVQRQLIKDAKAVEKKEKTEKTFQTVIIDTADLAFSMCEKYVLSQNGVTSMDETENKRGYKQLEKSFEDWFLELIKYNYTVIFISHSEDKQVKDPRTGEKTLMTIPTMEKRCAKVVTRAVDIMGYANSSYDQTGNISVTLTMRGNPELEAGSRFKYQSSSIPFTYEALVGDIHKAIERQEAEEGIKATSEKHNFYKEEEKKLTFEELMVEVKSYGALFNKNEKLTQFNCVAEKHLGVGAKLTQAKPLQYEAVLIALEEVKELAKELDLK